MVRWFGESLKKATAWDSGRSLFWQCVAMLVVWAYVVALHWHNDGLWYQGDAPVHATNGVFWLDFLRRLPTQPLEFALGYYARYPAINPTSYPPTFYLLEASLYALFGVSPFVSKGLVLGFALLGGFYLLAWLRRWIGPEAGWAGTLFLLQPSVMMWGHAVMLNLPGACIGVAALFHWRRWLEERTSRQLYLAALFALLTTLTYTSASVIILVMLAWAVFTGRTSALFDRRALILAGLCLLILLPWMVVLMKWAPAQRQVGLLEGDFPLWKPSSWIFYLRGLPRLATLPVLLLGFVCLVASLISRRWRKETLWAASWFLLCYLWFSIFSVKESRYVLLLVPPLLLLGALGIVTLVNWRLLAGQQDAPQITAALLILVLVLHLGFARRFEVPRVVGFKEIVEYVRQVAPDEWVFYDGYYCQLFTYYLRAADPELRRGVVRGSKLLYATKIDSRFGLLERVTSSGDVLNRLQRECGCRFLVVERETTSQARAEYYLREALTRPEFRLARSFAVQSPRVATVDVYEYLGQISAPDAFDIPFPVLGERAMPKIRPLKP